MNRVWCKRRSKINRWGLFANCNIPKGTDVIEYTGRRMGAKEGERMIATSAKYVFAVTAKIYIDGRPQWNPAGYMNHACFPNCVLVKRDTHVWIVAKKDIWFGDELTYDYHFPFEGGLAQECRCGHPRCIGYMISGLDHALLKKIARRVLRYERKHLWPTVGNKRIASTTSRVPH